jgi:NTE family protein
MKRGLVISGGGSKGSFAGGIIEYLNLVKGIEWTTGAGSSVGALLLPLSILGDIDTLKKYYTNITNTDIFSVNIYNKRGKFRILNSIWRLILGKTSFGEGGNLLKLLYKSLTEDKWNMIKDANKNAYITVSNFTTGKTEYKDIYKESYNDYIKYMLASASIPGIFEIVNVNDNQYLDGGVMESVPLQKMMDEGCDEIDIIILKVKEDNLKTENYRCNNIIDVITRTITLMNREISYDDIEIGSLLGEQKEIKLNFYYQPHVLTDNVVTLNTVQMEEWWNEGYNYAKNVEHKEIIIKKYKSGYKIK